MKKITISVIVPVYNVRQYLPKCIESIIMQSFTDYEIVIVDDGSTDGSGIICDTYAKNSEKVKVIHKTNGGLSDARNVGLYNSIGEYVVFLDSDDYWSDREFLFKLNCIIENENPDFVVFGYRKENENGVLSVYYPKIDTRNIDELIYHNSFNICAWDKCIKRSVLVDNNISFRVGVYSEDMEWCSKLYEVASSCAVIHEAPHSYRQRSGSITRSYTKKYADDIVKNYIECLNVKDRLDNNKRKIYDFYLSKNLSMIIIIISTLEESYRRNYDEFILENLTVLKSYTRKREAIIYYFIKIFGLRNTERLLYSFYKIRNRGYLNENN